MDRHEDREAPRTQESASSSLKRTDSILEETRGCEALGFSVHAVCQPREDVLVTEAASRLTRLNLARKAKCRIVNAWQREIYSELMESGAS